MPKIKDISGQTYGPFKVIKFDKLVNNRSYWVCQCACGNVRIIDKGNIKRSAKYQSHCYCNRKETKCNFPASKTKEYHAWLHIKSRCYNKKDKAYKNYGGRGITVCQRWLKSFRHFLNDLGFAPTKKHSIDRINNDGNYEPSNCRWATNQQQNNNTRKNIMIEYQGQIKSLPDWCRELSLSYDTIKMRLHVGWSVSDAFLIPIKTIHRRPMQSLFSN